MDENCRHGRPRNRRTSEEDREFQERHRVLRNERVRRLKKCAVIMSIIIQIHWSLIIIR